MYVSMLRLKKDNMEGSIGYYAIEFSVDGVILVHPDYVVGINEEVTLPELKIALVTKG